MSLLWMFLITFAILQVAALCTTIYLHRTLTHRAMEVSPSLALFMHAWLTMFTGISPREWVAVHRKHHHFSDKQGDPHSPRIYGLWKVFFGNVYYYRKVANDPEAVRKYTPDYKPTLVDKFPNQGYGVLLGWAIFAAMFGWGWGTAAFFAHAFTYIQLNASINSICHMIGYRNFDNLATNLRVLSFFTAGEALHNNHHEFPTAARFSMRPGEVDIAWPVIRLMEGVGLAHVKQEPLAKAA
ncbi:MAG: fatty acid desaturase [Bryobacteraceae bacterium]